MFGVDLAQVNENLGGFSDSLASQMLEFTESIPEFASRGATEIKEFAADGVGAVMGSADTQGVESSELDDEAQLEENLKAFVKNPQISILNDIIKKTFLSHDSFGRLIENVEQLQLDIKHHSPICGLQKHTVTRTNDVFPDKVMWLCDHHRKLLEKFNGDKSFSEEKLLEELDPKASAAACATTAPSLAASAAPASMPLPSSTLPTYRVDPQAVASNSSTATVRFLHQLPRVMCSDVAVIVATHDRLLQDVHAPIISSNAQRSEQAPRCCSLQ